jgi:ABC-2 type transport system ATP-binding protein
MIYIVIHKDILHIAYARNRGSKALKGIQGIKTRCVVQCIVKRGARKIFTLLGRNGAGKTTFIRICATQLIPTSGHIRVLGCDNLSEPDKVRKLISIVPQEGRPLRALTPWDHVYNWLQHEEEKLSEGIAKELTEEYLAISVKRYGSKRPACYESLRGVMNK